MLSKMEKLTHEKALDVDYNPALVQ